MGPPHNSSAWFRSPQPNPGARVRLLCFSHAGGGASLYHAWGRLLSPEIEVLGVRLPGREDRLQEPSYRRMLPLVEALVPLCEPLTDKPFALFGYSMGAIVAFELARHLRRLSGAFPKSLMVAARRAPQLADPLPPMYGLCEADLLRQLRDRHQGMPEVIVQAPELRALYLPILRADLEALETYLYRPEAPLSCPIFAIGGREDAIPPEDLAAWADQTSSFFRLHMIRGGHFFIKTSPEKLLAIVRDSLL